MATPGTYTATLFQRYTGVFNGTETGISKTIRVLSESDNRCYSGDGPLRLQAEDEGSELTVIPNKVQIWPNPVNEAFHITYEMPQEGQVYIQLVPLLGMEYETVTITKSHRPVGTFEETFYTDKLSAGMYLLSLETPNGTIKEKIIIQK